jgi:hypothetical protein
LSEKIRTEIEKFEEQNWERLCEKSKTDHRATAKMWRKIKNINNTSIHLGNINIKIDGINSPTEQEMADCFGKTLESTFQLDTDRFEHHQEAKSFKMKKPKEREEQIRLCELNNIINQLPTRKAPGEDNILFEHIKHLPENVKMTYLLFSMSH